MTKPERVAWILITSNSSRNLSGGGSNKAGAAKAVNRSYTGSYWKQIRSFEWPERFKEVIDIHNKSQRWKETEFFFVIRMNQVQYPPLLLALFGHFHPVSETGNTHELDTSQPLKSWNAYRCIAYGLISLNYFTKVDRDEHVRKEKMV